jgi:hypothetical protein
MLIPGAGLAHDEKESILAKRQRQSYNPDRERRKLAVLLETLSKSLLSPAT